MARILAALCSVLVLASAPAAQFRVVTASPADGAVAVPLADTLRFTFTEPLAPGAPPSIATFPADLITFGPPILSGDGLTLRYPVTHAADTRYVHLVMEARAASGQTLERPFALAYTTAASAGSFMVAGAVSAGSGNVDASIVALLGFDGAEVTVVDAGVLNGPAGNYTLGPVPFGVYSVGAVRLPHADPVRTFAYGFYDPDGDGIPNPVVIPVGVNLSINEPEPVLARARLAAATAQAQSRAPDAALYELAEIPVDTTGRSPFWRYVFYSPAQDSTLEVVETGLIPIVFATAGPPSALAQIFGEWDDSDVPAAAAEAAGGAAFRAAHAGVPQTLSLRAGLQPDVPTAATPCYRVAYRAFDPVSGSQTDSLLVYVTMAGGIVVPTAGEAGPDENAPVLEVPRPNPSDGRLSFSFTLARPAEARLEVFDTAGRLVAVVVEAAFGSGRHTVAWESPHDLPAGVYAIRLSVGGATTVRAAVIRR